MQPKVPNSVHLAILFHAHCYSHWAPKWRDQLRNRQARQWSAPLQPLQENGEEIRVRKVDRSCGFAKEFRFFLAVELLGSAIMNRLRRMLVGGPRKQDGSEQGQMGLRISRGLGPLTLLCVSTVCKRTYARTRGWSFGILAVGNVGNVEVSGS